MELLKYNEHHKIIILEKVHNTAHLSHFSDPHENPELQNEAPHSAVSDVQICGHVRSKSGRYVQILFKEEFIYRS